MNSFVIVVQNKNMIKKTKSILGFVAVLLFGLGHVQAENIDVKTYLDGIEKIKRVPINGLSMAKANGEIIFISSNGHYVIRNGKLLDVWNNIEIDNFKKLEESKKINFKQIGLNITDLTSIKVGNGDSEVSIFIDPYCPNCTNLLNHINTLKDEYTFNVIITPLLGKKSVIAAKYLVCNVDKDERYNVLLNKQFLNQAPIEDCKYGQIQKSMVTANLMGINAVPFTVSANGVTIRGFRASTYNKRLRENL